MTTETIEKLKTETLAATSQNALVKQDETRIGLTTSGGFELAQRAAKALSASTLVPKDYQNNLPNCLVALNMANRIGADPLMVMQNLYVVQGRPGWSAQFLIATFNTCGRFSAMRFRFQLEQGKDEWGCQAWAIEKETGEQIDGSWVTIALAKKEGWYAKNGSKWQTMPQQMLMYRAASFFVRAYAPELAMGLQTREENEDMLLDASPAGNGSYAVQDTGMPNVIQSLNEKLRGENVIDAETGAVVVSAEQENIQPDPQKTKPTMEEKIKKAQAAVAPAKCENCHGKGTIEDANGKGPCPDCKGG